MSLSSLSIKRPVLATVMALVILIMGGIGYTFLGVRDYPSVDPAIVTVSTSFPGANSDVIETQITEPLESAINSVQGIRSISSSSSDGSSRITVEFKLEVDMETAVNDVRDKVSGAMRRLPQDVDPPVVQKADADAQPIFAVTLRSDTRNIIDVSQYAELNFRERLQTISGVSAVSVWGSKKLAIRMKMDPARLAAYGLTPLDVRNAVTRENVELPSGRIEGDNTELTIRTLGRLRTVDEFNDLIITKNGDRVVKFSDIGTAEIDAENIRSHLLSNGKPSVNVVLVPQPGANYIDIVDNAQILLKQLEKDLPEDITMEVLFDNTLYIRESIKEVKNTIFVAFLLVVLVIFLFLRNWRTTLIPVVAIPVALIGAFFVMYLAGFTINILTLFAIVLSIGLVVDDAIVVVENIYTKVEHGMKPMDAALTGSREIYFAIIATTIALISVFFPIVFLQGVTGRLFREFSLVIVGAVIISAFLALSLTPMISSRVLKHNAMEGRFYRATEPFFSGMINFYRKAITSFLKVRYWALIIIVVAGGLIAWMWTLLPSEMAPLEDRGYVNISARATEGASYEYMSAYMDQIAPVVKEQVPESDNIMMMVGMGSVNSANMRVRLVGQEDRKRSQQEIATALSPVLRQYTGAQTIVSQQQTFGARRGGLPVQYVIQAKNLNDLKRVIPDFLAMTSESPYFSASDVNLKFTKPELTVLINREKASMMGINVQNIAQTLQLTMSEQRIGYYILDGKQYQIFSQFDKAMRNDPFDLTSTYVRNDKGQLIQLDNIVEIRENSLPPQLYRYNRFVSATVSAGLEGRYTLGEGIEEMDRIADRVLDENFSTTLSGDSKDFVESTSSLLFAFVLALVLIYLVLSAQFESFRDPIIILVTVPLALIGALFTMVIFGQTLNIFSQIGLIMLIGMVAKNGILIVEFANQRQQAGLSVMDAVREASVARFRPILMTSLTTILGIMPLALATGAGSESRITMGVTVVGGMFFATFLTLFVVPSVYSYLAGKKNAENSINDQTQS
ncbi:MAG: efflux RND transporter permease subunit [Bacteroidales bacterium]|nr:efflux RND transporter permease subunit [Bacteroidales bacterium]HNX83948.1 efflux RND transporter permease subunit [Bacteroidales bacterium]HPS98144.1 efflux RND transporter permease subunit [Bacteroidales bacterium]